MCASGKPFTNPSLPYMHIHKTTTTSVYMRPMKQDLIHAGTIRLSAPVFYLNPFDIYISDNIINQTLEIMYNHSLFADTCYVLSTNLLEVSKRPNNDTVIPRFHRHHLGAPDSPSLNSSYLLLPINITPIHWTILVRRQDATSGDSTIFHDSLSNPLDLISTQS